MNITEQSPYGRVQILQQKAEGELVTISAATDLGAYWGQGYATARLRLWQIDLTRRVAGGELCEILGANARRTDVFQRKLGLRELAQRESARCQKVWEETGKEELQSLQVKAYVEGVNHVLTQLKIWPIECLLLRYRPHSFTVEDVYAIAHLKYFINSAWQYEMFHTNMLKRTNAKQADQLFKTFTIEGDTLSALNYSSTDERTLAAEQAFQAGLEGLRMLGLASPDTGSNVFAISGERSATGAALLATDPHMGQVNPGYCFLCKLKSDEGLNVMGSNFPGAPGIVVGRNQTSAWGMVGLMADNQDLLIAEINWEKGLVKENGQWLTLQKTEHSLAIKGQKNATITTYSFERGRLIQKNENYGMFLRWPALDSPLGDITMYKLAKCSNWQEFKAAVSGVYNSPMMVGYADTHGDIGLQTIGLIPKRASEQGLGSLIQNQDAPASPWLGYIPFEELPSSYNPPEGYIAYANQYSHTLFDDKEPISNRWHPPSRLLRINELINKKPKLSVADFTQIQDDKMDWFARKEVEYLVSFLDTHSPLANWKGDTTEIENNLLFERWLYLLGREICSAQLGSKAFALYIDFWPSFRWCIVNILRYHLADWLAGEQLQQLETDYQAVVTQLVRSSYQKANVKGLPLPRIVFQHTIKQPAILRWLFTSSASYLGGGRETIHATRQNIDFLTASQTDLKSKPQKPFTFGPAFKLVSELGAEKSIWYAASTPANGSPFFWSSKANLKKWLEGKRFKITL